MFEIKRISKDYIIYSLSIGLSSLISFLFIPIYTRIFSPSEYAKIEILTVITNIASTIFCMGMDSALTQYFYKLKKYGLSKQAELVSSIIQWRILFGTITVILATTFSPLINKFFFDGELNVIYFFAAFTSALFLQIMSQSADLMRLRYKPWDFLKINLSYSLLFGLLFLLFLLFEKSILSYFLGILFSSLIVSLYSWSKLKQFINFNKIHWNLWPELLKFSFPLLISGLLSYLIASNDRWFINYYHGKEDLGIFAIGAKFAIISSLIAVAFNKAWFPLALENLNSDKINKLIFKKVARIYIGISSGCVIFLTLISPLIINIFTSFEYKNAWPIIGILSWQTVFFNFSNNIGCLGIFKVGKTKIMLPLMITSLLIGISLNFIFVPSFGGIGAALATSITFLIWSILVLFFSERYFKIGFPIINISLQILYGIISTTLVIYFHSVNKIEYNFLIALLTLIFLYLYSFNSFERKQILLLLKKTIQRSNKFFK